MSNKATAVWIKSESADNYLYNFQGWLTDEEALERAEGVCYEDRECWCDWMVVQTKGEVEV